MPYIYKPKPKRDYTKREKTKAVYDNIYNTGRWRKLRAGHLLEHPLCEMCQREGKVTPATDVHHVREISHGDTLEDMLQLGFDPTNLMSLCEDCHNRLHGQKRTKKNDPVGVVF